eukprot:5571260-Pyramimonas_sp.AAC.1
MLSILPFDTLLLNAPSSRNWSAERAWQRTDTALERSRLTMISKRPSGAHLSRGPHPGPRERRALKIRCALQRIPYIAGLLAASPRCHPLSYLHVYMYREREREREREQPKQH